MGIAREGYPLILGSAAVSVGLWAVGWAKAAAVAGIASAAIAAFFRDPERAIPAGDGVVVSPADGKVVSITPVNGETIFSKAVTRVSIFLSPLDVHINRMPVAGTVEFVRYQPGKFLAAYKEDSSSENEQNALVIKSEGGAQLGVVQIAGVIARRIICHAKAGDRFRRGDRFGLIMFGSRTDTYLPEGFRLEVVEGQRVKGGETVLGRFV
jgi:phosphatidylserine decarboxylase